MNCDLTRDKCKCFFSLTESIEHNVRPDRPKVQEGNSLSAARCET